MIGILPILAKRSNQAYSIVAKRHDLDEVNIQIA